ncbi:phytanoyl-CoA dioxygenase family protein [soil metagenome]
MKDIETHKREIAGNGYTIIDKIYSNPEIEMLLKIISHADTSKPNFRKTTRLFAIRRFLNEIPETQALIFTKKLNTLITSLFGEGYFVVKSIYFDKPGDSNWFVSYHQDLTISVDRKTDIPGFGPWTVKEQQFAVQPPLSILQQNFTIRIHLDETNENNGALRVIPGSHVKAIYRPEKIDWTLESKAVCEVSKGGIMIMRPLLQHASGRTINHQSRRVIHIEFSNQRLPEPLNWSELQQIDFI